MVFHGGNQKDFVLLFLFFSLFLSFLLSFFPSFFLPFFLSFLSFFFFALSTLPLTVEVKSNWL